MKRRDDGSIEYSWAEVAIYQLIAQTSTGLTTEHMHTSILWPRVRQIIDLCKTESDDFAEQGGDSCNSH